MNKKIIIASGGTGGHIFPGLAVAEELVSKNCNVLWIGTLEGMEAKLIPKYNLEIKHININGIRGKNWLTKIFSSVFVVIAIFQSIKILYLYKPDLVLGMGGFVAGPVGIAAWLLRKKLIIHEQNAIAGSSNRILALFAKKVLESFPNSFPENKYYLHKVILTGLPIRKALIQSNKENNYQDKSTKFKILVLGGSRGAKFLNEIIPTALGSIDNLQVTHQTGEQDFTNTKDLYLRLNPNHSHQIISFIDDMAKMYNLVDLVICRAGASTIFELLGSGAASILIPLPWAIDDHQTKNASYLENNKAAILLKQNEITGEKLKTLVIELMNNGHKINSLREAAKFLYKPYEYYSSSQKISELILNA